MKKFSSEKYYIFGKHAAFGALKSKRRKIFEIIATNNTIAELEKFLSENNLKHLKSLIRIAENKQIDFLTGKGQAHQGFAIACTKLPIQNQNEFLEEIYAIKDETKLPKLVLLDQISDPQNIGAIIRSAAAFGFKKIIFCEHNSPKETPSIVKASAGNIENVDLVFVVNFNNLMEKLKKVGYWFAGLDGSATGNIETAKTYKNIALIIGGEGNGIRDLVKKNCDILVKIDMDKNVESLNASAAASIAFYELNKT